MTRQSQPRPPGKGPQGLLIATRNAGKLAEFRRLLSGLPLRLFGLDDFPSAGEAVEDGKTFAENAAIKARYYSSRTGLTALADDSGLEVEALGGEPGVHSARYAGPEATDAERILRLLKALEATADTARRARFVCALALVEPGREDVRIFSGACRGSIAPEPRGGRGFGYDPVFIPEGYSETFGQLPSEVKNRISHRARALDSLREYFEQRFHGL